MIWLFYLILSGLLNGVGIVLLQAVYRTKGLRLLRIFFVAIIGVMLLAFGVYYLIIGVALMQGGDNYD